jgi:hypothetical protein
MKSERVKANSAAGYVPGPVRLGVLGHPLCPRWCKDVHGFRSEKNVTSVVSQYHMTRSDDGMQDLIRSELNRRMDEAG